MPALSTDHRKGLLITGIGGLALTIDIPLLKLADGEAWSVLLLRTGVTLLAALVIWAVWRLVTPNAPKLVPGRKGLMVAGLYGLGSIFFVSAVYNTTTANLVFILAFNSMFAALLSWIFLGERPRAGTLLAMAVMVMGILIIVWDSVGAGNLLGDLLAAASALTIASAITISRASGEDMGFAALVGVVLPLGVAAVMVGSVGFHVEQPWWIVLNGAIIMPLSFFCLATGPRYITGPEVAMFYLLETVLAPVWMWLIFLEKPSGNALVGGVILVVALVAHSVWQLMEGRRRRAAAAISQPA
ncbi:DMT family transporter [Mesorhizobium marinum]|uniref:DMT family transporter n=1 Tax=Mesorhizobium marinum TaxID=3228790 RepID=A0ABV3R4H1_9HYPH